MSILITDLNPLPPVPNFGERILTKTTVNQENESKFQIKIVTNEDETFEALDKKVQQKHAAKDDLKKNIEQSQPFHINKRPGLIELWINGSLMEKLEKSSFSVIVSNSGEMKDLIDLSSHFKKNVNSDHDALPNWLPIEKDDSKNRLEKSSLGNHSFSENRPRRHGFTLDKTIHPETIKKISNNINASNLYAQKLAHMISTHKNAKAKLESLKSSKNKWSVTNLFEKDVENIFPGKTKQVFRSPDQELDFVTLNNREEQILDAIEKQKFENNTLSLDIRALKQEICLYDIQKDKVF